MKQFKKIVENGYCPAQTVDIIVAISNLVKTKCESVVVESGIDFAVLDATYLQGWDSIEASDNSSSKKKKKKSDGRKNNGKKKRTVEANSSPADDEVYASETAKPKPKKLAKTLFKDATRDGVRSANPTMLDKEINKLLDVQWNAASTEERAPYEAKAAADKERYNKEMAAFKAEGSAKTNVKTTKTSTKKSAARNVSTSSSRKRARALPTKSSRAPLPVSKGGYYAASLMAEEMESANAASGVRPALPPVRLRDNAMAPDGAIVPMVSHSYSSDSGAPNFQDAQRRMLLPGSAMAPVGAMAPMAPHSYSTDSTNVIMPARRDMARQASGKTPESPQKTPV